MNFYELKPDFECLIVTYWSACQPSQFCTNPDIQHRVNYDKDTSLNNLYSRLNLACDPQYKIGYIGSCWFLGFLFTLSFVPRLADIYGRKMIYQISCFLLPLLYILIYFTHSLSVFAIITFCLGSLQTG
jgi:MFS family permease